MVQIIERSGIYEDAVIAVNKDFRRKGVALGADNRSARRTSAAESLRVYYMDNASGRVGILGLAYALLAWSASRRRISARSLAHAVAGRLTSADVSSEDRDLLSEDQLRAWFQPSRYIRLPSPPSAGAVRGAIIGIASDYGLERASELIERSWQSPGDLLTAMLGLPMGTDVTHSSSQISVRGYVDLNYSSRSGSGRHRAFAVNALPDLYRPVVDELGDFITGERGRHSIVVLCGDPLSGKSGVIVELLRRFADLNNNTMIVGRGTQSETLPLFASSNFGSIHDQLVHVAQFLDIAGQLDELGTTELLKQVEEHAASKPAIYIFGDFPLGDSSATAGNMPEALTRFLGALKSEHSKSRILLTCQHRPESELHSIFRNLSFNTCLLPSPMAGPIIDLLGLQSDIISHRTIPLDGPTVALIAAAASIQTDAPARNLLEADIAKALTHSDNRAAMGRLRVTNRSAATDAVRRWEERIDLRALAKIIYDRIPSTLQRILLYASMTEGGLSRGLLDDLREKDKLLRYDDGTTITLNAFKDSIGQIGTLSPENYDDGDFISHNDKYLSHIITFEPVIRIIFERMLLEHYPTVARDANRLVAQFLRHQRYDILLSTDIMEGKSTETFIRRSGEYLRRALISIPPDTKYGSQKNAGVFYQIRELYNDLFSSEIDGNFRLSFQLGLDDLRLNLIESFLNIGFPVYSLEYSDGHGNEDWSILKQALLPSECIEFVNSLAIAARRSRAWLGVKKAAQFADELVNEGRAKYSDLSLAFRARIDSALLKVGAPGFPENLEAILDSINDALRRLGEARESLIETDKLSLMSDEIKMRARLASALIMLGRDEEALSEFQNCRDLDIERLQTGNRQRASTRWLKPAYAGMGPRRHLHLLMRQALKVAGDDVTNLRSAARDLHRSSLTRVSKHPREKMLFIIDEIALLAAEGHLEYAHQKFIEFSEYSPNSNLTLQSRMEMDFICMQISEFLWKNKDRISNYKQHQKDVSAFMNKITYRMCAICISENLPIYALRLKAFSKTSSFREFNIDIQIEKNIEALDTPDIGLAESWWPTLAEHQTSDRATA